MFSYSLVILSLGLFISLAHGAADCSKKPSEVGKDCCRLPMPNFGAFQAKCSAYQPPATNPCFLECMFNSTNTINGENFNIENGRKMLSILFNGNQEFIDAYILGFQQCQPEIEQRLVDYKAKTVGSLPKTAECNLFGYFYGICAHEMILRNCPKSAWNQNAECEAAKEIAVSCKPLSFFK